MSDNNRDSEVFEKMFAEVRQTLTPPGGLKETVRSRVIQQDDAQQFAARPNVWRRFARPRWLGAAAAVLVVAGAGAAMYSMYVRHQGGPDGPAGGSADAFALAAPQSPASTAVTQRLQRTSLSLGIPHMLSLGDLMTADATSVGALAPLIYKLRLTGAIEDATTHRVSGYEAEVLRVFKGDPAAEGRQVVLTYPPPQGHQDLRLGDLDRANSRYRSFLDNTFLKPADLKEGEVVLIAALAPADPAVDERGRPILIHAFTNGIMGTRVEARNVSPPSATVVANPLPGLRLELLAALEDRSPVVRRSAIGALSSWCGDIGPLSTPGAPKPPTELWTDPAARQALLHVAGDSDARVRRAVAFAIAKHGGQEEAVAGVLTHLLYDPDRMVRQAARFWLGRFGRQDLAGPANEAEDCPLDEWFSGWHTEWYMDTSKTMLSWLGDKQVESRMRAAWLLGDNGYTEAVEALIGALQDEQFEVRRGAAHSLGVLGKPEAANFLAAAMNDQDGRVRVMAAWSLARLGDPRGLDRLVLMLKDADVRSAVQAAELLGALAKEESVPALLEALGDGRPAVCGAAVMATRPFLSGPNAGAIQAALRQLEAGSKAPYVREAVTAVLGPGK